MAGKIIALGFILLCIVSCESSNFIESKKYKTKQERIKVLKKYFKLRSEILDARYTIFDVNLNNRSIPGPTSRDFKVIVKIDPANFQKWDEPDNITTEPLSYDWAIAILQDNADTTFALSGEKIHYVSQYKEMTIFKETGVVVISIVQN